MKTIILKNITFPEYNKLQFVKNSRLSLLLTGEKDMVVYPELLLDNKVKLFILELGDKLLIRPEAQCGCDICAKGKGIIIAVYYNDIFNKMIEISDNKTTPALYQLSELTIEKGKEQ